MAVEKSFAVITLFIAVDTGSCLLSRTRSHHPNAPPSSVINASLISIWLDQLGQYLISKEPSHWDSRARHSGAVRTVFISANFCS